LRTRAAAFTFEKEFEVRPHHAEGGGIQHNRAPVVAGLQPNLAIGSFEVPFAAVLHLPDQQEQLGGVLTVGDQPVLGWHGWLVPEPDSPQARNFEGQRLPYRETISAHARQRLLRRAGCMPVKLKMPDKMQVRLTSATELMRASLEPYVSWIEQTIGVPLGETLTVEVDSNPGDAVAAQLLDGLPLTSGLGGRNPRLAKTH
jgi:hypothetical protein